MTKTILLLIIGLAMVFSLQAQNSPAPTSPAPQLSSFRDKSLLKNYPVRNIGPTVQGGRITDIEVDPRDPNTFYLGYASGGIFKTTTNGGTFEPVFDHQGALGIGDLALSPANPDHIWVGTGENNSSRSSYAGNGVYKSTDGGKSWTHLGLAQTQHIGRVVCHPTDENTAWVAAMGALYSENEDRGVYKTSDGGKTWKKTLFVNSRTGIIDLVVDPNDPNRLWAASWDRIRKAWQFTGEGSGSAIYASHDGGLTWKKSVNGFPQTAKTGRIGLAISNSVPGFLYAVVDNQEKEESLLKEDTICGLTITQLGKMNESSFLEIKNEKLDTFLRDMGFPQKYTGELVKQDVQDGKYTPKDLAGYFGDANEALFSAAIKGTEVYRSNDLGQTWTRTHDELLTGIFYTYGYYFGQIRVAPDNPNEIYIYGVPLLKSGDAGKTWSRLDTADIHVDHHDLWFNPKDADHVLLGNDGGLYQSYDRGGHWNHLNNMPVGQFYTVAVDDAKPNYNVYGGLQDNGVYMAPSNFRPNQGKYWSRLFGGDGMFVALDHRNPDLVYTGYQFGHYYRLDRKGGEPKYITPKHDIGQPKYRFNWRTPVVTSPHTPEIVYMGSQYLFRSLDMGDNFQTISPDLTQNKSQGNVPYSTISTIAESPLRFGLIWVGTDDGNVQVTPDGGLNWLNVSAGLPANLWVSKVFASPHQEKTAFVSLTGYRNDNFATYLYKTTDLGKTWQSIKGNLPEDGVNCIIQDPVNPELLFCGQDHALFASLDGGKSWEIVTQLPNVAMYDLVIQARAKELVVGSHGRSVFVLDIEPLQKVAGANLAQDLLTWDKLSLTWSKEWGKKEHPYSIPKEPKVKVRWYAGQAGKDVKIEWKDESGKVLKTYAGSGEKGFQSLSLDLNLGSNDKKSWPAVGKYTLSLQAGKAKAEIPLEIKKKEK
ncbi:MAG: glycosyl hydrolase [Bacteroidia bacterium]|nr:glycosyl hydrolase [Bacteroidia bacterium]